MAIIDHLVICGIEVTKDIDPFNRHKDQSSMKTIEYSNQGEPISDFDCDLLAREFLLREGDQKIIVSTALFITAVRVHINEGLVPCEEVEFLYQGLLLCPNKDGRLQEWPNGFCDVEERLLYRLLPKKE